jgi:hypothetical protein
MKKPLPVGELENTAQATVDDYKGHPKARKLEDNIRIAQKVLNEAVKNMAEGFEYFAENGEPLTSPEAVMQLALSNKQFKFYKPEKKEEQPKFAKGPDIVKGAS